MEMRINVTHFSSFAAHKRQRASSVSVAFARHRDKIKSTSNLPNVALEEELDTREHERAPHGCADLTQSVHVLLLSCSVLLTMCLCAWDRFITTAKTHRCVTFISVMALFEHQLCAILCCGMVRTAEELRYTTMTTTLQTTTAPAFSENS